MRLFEGTPFDRPPRCERCDELEELCRCEPEGPTRNPPEQQTARLSVEKRKKGKSVTVVRGLDPDGTDLPELLTRIKSQCGAGGTIKDGTLEIQGDQLQKVEQCLRTIGFKIRSGR